MKQSTARYIVSLTAYILCVWGAIAWYDWKLLVLMFLFITANNNEQVAKALERFGK